MKLTDRIVLITGSTKGIGKAIALLFAKEGADVIINARKPGPDARKTLGELSKSTKGNHSFVAADVKNPGEIFKMMKEVEKRYKKLHVLVNNAGKTRFIEHKNLKGLTPDIFDEIYSTHLRGAFLCTQKAVDLLKKSKDALVVNIASVAAESAVGSNIAYCAAKAGLINMTKSLARALAPGIRVNAVSPGLTETGLITGWGAYKKEQLSRTPLGRLANTEDVARAVLALATEMNYVTGQNLTVDGGRTLE